jgi:hypothetical protein
MWFKQTLHLVDQKNTITTLPLDLAMSKAVPLTKLPVSANAGALAAGVLTCAMAVDAAAIKVMAQSVWLKFLKIEFIKRLPIHVGFLNKSDVLVHQHFGSRQAANSYTDVAGGLVSQVISAFCAAGRA